MDIPKGDIKGDIMDLLNRRWYMSDLVRCCKSSKGKSQEKDGKKVDFRFEGREAKKVMLVGSFNNWDYTRTPLTKTKTDGWAKSLLLKHGRYEYKFVVDGNWVIDQRNSNKVRNSFGTENSVIEVR